MIDLDTLLRVGGMFSIAGGFGAGLRYLGKQVEQMREDFKDEMRELRKSVETIGTRLDQHGERLTSLEVWQKFLRPPEGA